MDPNVSKIDASFRVIVGMAIIFVGIYSLSWWAFLGVFLILTAAIRWCPVYKSVTNITCSRDKTD